MVELLPAQHSVSLFITWLKYDMKLTSPRISVDWPNSLRDHLLTRTQAKSLMKGFQILLVSSIQVIQIPCAYDWKEFPVKSSEKHESAILLVAISAHCCLTAGCRAVYTVFLK